jgi:arginine deiminase
MITETARVTSPGPIVAAQPAEWLPATTILLCEPGIETLFAVLETDAANFLHPFNLLKGRTEHRRFRDLLQSRGAQVIDLREALTHGTGSDRDRLRRWAREALTYEAPAVTPRELTSLAEHREATIEALDPGSLADIVMLRPVITLRSTIGQLDPTSRYSARYTVRPADNSYFMRDPMITTARGTVVGRLRLDARAPENDIVYHALEQLGIEPICRVCLPGYLEGGDFIPCGSFVLQGQGSFTNPDGVEQLLTAGAYGEVEVAVVRDPRARMDKMHLDAYFSVFGPDLCAICDDRLGDQQPSVDVWEPQDGSYSFVGSRPFLEYLDAQGMEVITFTKAEQDRRAANGLLTAEKQYIGDRQAGDRYQRLLEQCGVEAEWIEFEQLAGGYGGPRCSSQVISRGPPAQREGCPSFG